MGWVLLIGFLTFPYYWGTLPERCRSRRSMVLEVLGDPSPSAP